MKDAYVTPELEIIRFVTTDVITDSNPGEDETEPVPFDN